MDIAGIIFDLDGVICSTDKYHYLAWKALADELGINFDETINNRLRGVSRLESLDIILENSDKVYSEAEKQEFADRKNKLYQELIRTMSPDNLSEDVKTTLVTLKDNGYKLAIGSSSKNARLILKQIGLEDFFDEISDGNNIRKSKPDPEVFLKAAEMLHIEPERCIVVEDALSGIDAAVAGNFMSAGIAGAADHPHVTWPIRQLSDLLTITGCKNK